MGYTKIVAIDPQLDAIKFMNWKHTLISKNISVHGMDNRIENLSSLYGDKMHQKVLMIFARPCHSDFVENALNLKGQDVEALYITVPENIEKYCDLGVWDSKKVLLQHEGSSADNEIVFSLK